MTKKVIAIISVLKPVDDTRNFEKVASSISNTNKYEINIIGFSAKKVPLHQNIVFHPVFNFRRISLSRFLLPLKVWGILIKLKPELIIVTCAELLIVSVTHKILFGSKIIYDIQENYYRNILYSGAYPILLKYPIAWTVRCIEKIACIFIDRIILAEKIYESQLKFVTKKSIVLENKALIPTEIFSDGFDTDKEIVLVYSGTIAEHYGIFDAIAFVKRLHESVKKIKLIIIGYASQVNIQKKLIAETEKDDYIEIIGNDRLVPHDQILMTINQSSMCILPYARNKSTEGRIPTKVFECLAMEKPVIISSNPAWNSIIKKNNAGIIYDFESQDEFDIMLLQGKFYGNNLSFQYTWESNSIAIIKLVVELI